MTLRVSVIGLVGVMTACGGAAATEPATAVAPTAPAPVVEAPTVSDAPPVLSNAQVAGLWCEYWIAPSTDGSSPATPARSADTQQYLFLEDGRFGWRAETAAGQEPKQRSGQWRVEGSAIVLRDGAGQVIEQLAIAECPDNPEAEQLDARYQCRSLGGKAFWLSKPTTEVDSAQYIR